MVVEQKRERCYGTFNPPEYEICTPSEATIYINHSDRNLEKIDETIDIWRMIFASFQFTHFSVFLKPVDDDGKSDIQKIAEFDLSKPD